MDYAKNRTEVAALFSELLDPDETVEAVLPFAVVSRQPKRSGGTNEGIRQRTRRYRPIVLTNRRLFLLETGRTPHARGVLAEFRNGDVEVGPVTRGRFGASTFTLELAGVGEVPFVIGRYELDDLARLVTVLGTERPG